MKNILSLFSSLWNPQPTELQQVVKEPRKVQASKLFKGAVLSNGAVVSHIEHLSKYKGIGYSQVRVHFKNKQSVRVHSNELVTLG